MDHVRGPAAKRQPNEYDVCVVGAGTFGSAAARHLTNLHPEKRVLLIGPSEKKDRLSTDIHGAYYDQGRVTRTVDADPLWDVLGHRSLRSFRAVERTAGTEFFHEVGYLGIGPSSDKYLTGLISAAQTQNFPFRELTTLELRQICPYMNISAEYSCGILIERDAGYINPRDMVAAQKICAEKAGCEIINDVVRRIIPPREADGYNVLITDNGRLFYSRKILLATGAFTHCRRLLPREVQPDVALQAEAMAMVEIPRHMLENFTGMPSIVHMQDEHRDFAYILPPIKHPDGKYYLKISHGKVDPEVINSPESIKRWYARNQHGYIEDYLLRSLKQYFPELDTSHVQFDYAVTAHTPSGYPYIDMVTSSLGVVIAGNGRGARAADEIGHIAARMIMNGHWDSDLPPEAFILQTKKVMASSKL